MDAFDFDLDFRFNGGWCTLRLTNITATVKVESYWLSNNFASLLEAIVGLLGGVKDVGVRWSLEQSGGYFIDFSTGSNDMVSIAVHEQSVKPNVATTAEDVDSAVRGSAIFTAYVPMWRLGQLIARELRRSRARDVDRTGFMTDWGHTFPQGLQETLERKLFILYGHTPEDTEEMPSSK